MVLRTSLQSKPHNQHHITCRFYCPRMAKESQRLIYRIWEEREGEGDGERTTHTASPWLMADLHMTYAMFKFLSNARAMPIHQALSVQRSKDREIRMLYGFPGHILKLPFYLDFTPSNIKYEWLLAAIRENNPGFALNKARGDQLMAHVYENEFRGTSDKLAEYHSRMLRMVSTKNGTIGKIHL